MIVVLFSQTLAKEAWMLRSVFVSRAEVAWENDHFLALIKVK